MNQFCEITPELRRLAAKSAECSKIDPELYTRYDVKRGLRDLNGKGVLVGLTEISEVSSTKIVNGESVPADGELFYRGYNVKDLIAGLPEDSHFGFEECTYLLLFGKLPKKHELRDFSALLSSYRTLPTSFVRDIIMKAPSKDMMNTLARSVLTLYSYDEMADDVSLPNVLRQCLQLISLFPLLSVYGYQAYKHYHDGASLFIHSPKEEYSTAENILHILRPDSKFSPLEAKLLDIALILHMEHGGGNNSTFTNVVISSTGTDIYSTVCGSIGSMKGPRHGGANIKVAEMMDAVLEETGGYTADDKKIKTAVNKLMDGELYDRTGLVYGFGHAVYTISDPRAEMLRARCLEVAKEKKMMTEFDFRQRFERIALETMKERKGVALPTNVDYYSGFAYEMLGIPRDLYTPLFVCSRMVGWVAHNIENKLYDGRIMRPATKYVGDNKEYTAMEER